MNEAQAYEAKVARETETCRKNLLTSGYRVRSDFGGEITMVLQEWPFIVKTIDKTVGYVTSTNYPA